MRSFSPIDLILEHVDAGLRALSGNVTSQRTRPDKDIVDAPQSERTASEHGRYMRINHTGEICAQALYHGQALTARKSDTRHHLLHAAEEEGDHLAWCADRANELGTRTSFLNPIFYAQSFTLGALAGLAGDRWSYGFINETEQQVYQHLETHRIAIGDTDPKSAKIIEQMQADEKRHGEEALQAGGSELPLPIKLAMKCAAKVMTSTTYHI